MIVEHGAERKSLPRRSGEFAQAREILGADRRGRLDLQADDPPVPVLEDDIDLIQLLVPEGAQREAVVGPACELEDLLEHEGFENGAETGAIRCHLFGCEAGERGQEA